MFFGEFIVLGMYGIKKFLNPSVENNSQSNKINPMTLAIPAIFDILATTTMFIALTNVAASVFQMMRGFIVVITALMAMFLLGRKQFVHHWLSLITIVFGVAFVGYVSILDS